LDINKLNPAQADPSIRDFTNYLILELEFIGILIKAIGFSIPNFIESKRYDDNEVAIFKEKLITI
jgi:hypothetical protein